MIILIDLYLQLLLILTLKLLNPLNHEAITRYFIVIIAMFVWNKLQQEGGN